LASGKAAGLASAERFQTAWISGHGWGQLAQTLVQVLLCFGQG
jgi:hypothetical protein